MKKNYIQKIAFLFFLMAGFLAYSGSVSAQVTIAQWGFDAETLIPDVGNGVAENVGGTTTAFYGGNPSSGKGWNTTDYPEQGTASGTAGVQFTVSTSGYSDINISWDNRNSNTAANRLRLQYTLNGTDWVNFEANAGNATNNSFGGAPIGFDNGRYIADVGGSWFIRGAQLNGISGANNNPAFAVRMVTEFGNGTEYLSSNPDGAYGTGGTTRFDNVTFVATLGTDVPYYEMGSIYTYGKTLNVTLNQTANANVQVINLCGQQVASYNLNSSTATYNLDVPAGIYIVRMVSSLGTTSSKVMVR